MLMATSGGRHWWWLLRKNNFGREEGVDWRKALLAEHGRIGFEARDRSTHEVVYKDKYP
ncbi:hypothetical protein NC652_038177 [Populus alba x Populus x berolinensis]|nr:hypothetical protein NC652_038177 [Populus alba x Populus x berolinensis]